VHEFFFFFLETEKKKKNVEELGVDGGTILKLIFKKWDAGCWNGLFWLKTRTGGGLV